MGVLAIAGILFGAELTVERSRSLARSLGVSDFYIGLTLLSIGTSFPEIFTHVFGSLGILRGVGSREVISSIVVGTNIGSNLVQITVIVGIVAFYGRLEAERSFLRGDYLVMLVSIVLLFFFSLDGRVSRVEGVLLVSFYVLYLWRLSRQEAKLRRLVTGRAEFSWWNPFLVVVGLAILLVSADQVVKVSVYLVEEFQVSGSLLGVLVIGVSTAIPELTTSISALRHRSSSLSLGTLVGSNITNPMFALGLGAAITSYTIPWEVLWFDIPYWFFASLLPLFFFYRKLYMKKREAAVLFACYTAYAYLRIYFV